MKPTPVTKALLIVVLLAAAFGAWLKFVKPNMNKTAKATVTTTAPKKSGLGSIFTSAPDATIVVNTWGGYAGLALLNGGTFEPNKDCIFYKEYGITVKIVLCDAVADSRNTFLSGNADILYCTYDAIPTEMGIGSAMAQSGAQGFAQVDWSRKGDAIVVTKNINRVSDLRGKTVACAIGSASNTLLIKMLEANQMTMADIKLVEVSDGIEAAKFFKAGTVDAAVVWTPDDSDCQAVIAGSKILVSTGDAPYIIADGLLASKKFIENKHDVLVKFTTAWLTMNGKDRKSVV
jgi:NitT/TauT family transport system substrate-binding protein